MYFLIYNPHCTLQYIYIYVYFAQPTINNTSHITHKLHANHDYFLYRRITAIITNQPTSTFDHQESKVTFNHHAEDQEGIQNR